MSSLPSDTMASIDYTGVFLVIVTLIGFFVPVFLLFPPISVQPSDALLQTHSKLGLSPSESNLRTQHSPIHSPRPGKPAKIQALYIHPIKSCRGIEISRAKILPNGMQYDRLYTLAYRREKAPEGADDAQRPDWEIVTLRVLPLLANVKVDLWLPDQTKSNKELGKAGGGAIIVRFPWKDEGFRGLAQWVSAKLRYGLSGEPEKEFMIPVDFPSQEEIAARGYKYEDIKVWKDVPAALNMEQELPRELAQYLGAKHHLGLFKMDPDRFREVYHCAPKKDKAGYQPVIGFQDAYPLHMLSLSSLHALEANITKDPTIQRLDVRRFRANIIISGMQEYDEDDWRVVRFKRNEIESDFDVSCRTVRCKLPNVDPATGIRHKTEPDSSLRKFRDIDEGAPKKGCFGMQLCPLFADTVNSAFLESTLEVGMDVDVVRRGSHFAI